MPRSDDIRSALVVCVGNSLVADDAVGCAVFEALKRLPLPSHVRVEMLGVGGLRVLDLLEGEEVFVAVDAVSFGAAAGNVTVNLVENLPPAGRAVTSHGVGFREALQVGHLLEPEKMPGDAWLVGVEGSDFTSVGTGMTPAVQAAVPAAVVSVLELVGQRMAA